MGIGGLQKEASGRLSSDKVSGVLRLDIRGMLIFGFWTGSNIVEDIG